MSNSSKPVSGQYEPHKAEYSNLTDKKAEGKPKGIPPELLVQTLSQEQKLEKLNGSKVFQLNSSSTVYKSMSDDGQWERFVGMLKSTKKSIEAFLSSWNK